MSSSKPTFQHGYGFELGEGIFALANGVEFDTRPFNAKKKVGSSKETWDAHHASFPNIVRKQGEDYSKKNKIQLQRLVAKRQLRLKKGESLNDAKVEQLTSWLKQWEKFER